MVIGQPHAGNASRMSDSSTRVNELESVCNVSQSSFDRSTGSWSAGAISS